MSIPVNEYDSICEIFGKLTVLRDDTNDCAKKLLNRFSSDKWIDKELLASLSNALTHLDAAQNKLQYQLNSCKINTQETMTDTKKAVDEWYQKELSIYMTQELKVTLDEICQISYSGNESEILADLEKLKNEAKGIKADLNNYKAHESRIADFKSLVSWIRSDEPLGFKRFKTCQEKFGGNLSFAVMNHLLQINNNPITVSVMEQETLYEDETGPKLDTADNVTSPDTEPAKVVEDSDKPEEQDEFDYNVPTCEIYDHSLTVESHEIKRKMLKNFSAFKSEFMSHMGNDTFRNIGVAMIGIVLDKLITLVNPKHGILSMKFSKRDYSSEYVSVGEKLLDMGLFQKVSYKGIDAYKINPKFLQIAKMEGLRKLVNADIPINVSLSYLDNESLKDIWVVREILRNYFINQIADLFSTSSCYVKTRDDMTSCLIKFNGIRSSGGTYTAKIIIPLFEKDNVKEELNGIIKDLSENNSKKSNYIFLINNEEEEAFWRNAVKPYNIGNILFYYLGRDDREEKRLATFIKTDKKLCVSEQLVDDITEKQKALLPSDKAKSEDSKGSVTKEDKTNEEKKDSYSVKKDETQSVSVKKDPSAIITSEKEKPSKQSKKEILIKPKKHQSVSSKENETSSSESLNAIEETFDLLNKNNFRKQVPDMVQSVSREIGKHHMAEGMLMLHGIDQQLNGISRESNLPLNEEWAHYLLAQVSYILGDPLYSYIQTKESPDVYWSYNLDIPEVDIGKASEYFNAASMIRYFFNPSYGEGAEEYYKPEIIWKQLSKDSSNTALQEIPEIKNVIRILYNFWQKHNGQKGLGACFGGETQVKERQTKELGLCKNALRNTHQLLENKKSNVGSFPRLTQTYDTICRNSDLALYVGSAEESSVDELLAFCNQFAENPVTKEKILVMNSLNFTVSRETVTSYVDKVWRDIEVPRGQTERFVGVHKNTLMKVITNALGVLAQYVFARCRLESNSSGLDDLTSITKAMHDVEEYGSKLLAKLKNYHSNNFMETMAICCMRYLVKSIIKSFSPSYKQMYFYEPFLLTRYVELDGRYIPIIDFDYKMPGMNLYNRCMKHIEEIDSKKLEPNTDCYKQVREEAQSNWSCIGLYKLLSVKLGVTQLERKEEDIEKEGHKYIEKAQRNFKSDLELDYNYGRLTQKNEIVFYENLSDSIANHLLETQNFGLFDDFARACKDTIDVNSRPRKLDLEKQFYNVKESLKKKIEENGETLSDYPILDDIQKCLNNRNYCVAEDYIRLCQDGHLIDLKSLLGNVPEEFMSFMQKYQSYFKVCSRKAKYDLENILGEWYSDLGTSIPNNATGKGQRNFVQTWVKLFKFSGKNNVKGCEPIVQSFIESLGYPTVFPTDIKARKQSNNRISCKIYFTSEPTGSYSHPFKQFGSGIFKNGLRIITLPSGHTVESIKNELIQSKLEKDVGTICLLDNTMSLAERCELAKMMKCSSELYNVIVIDRIVALYLSQFERMVRENKMMKICMPFANAVPFKYTGPIAPDMFIGRTHELAEIRDMDGPNLVYGGRQLGKSILLKQVSLLDHHPDKHWYAFYFEVKGKGDIETLNEISKSLQNEHLIEAPIESWNDFGNVIDSVMDKVKQIILLIDEADAFITASNAKDEYPIEVLRETQNNYTGKFKFVLAGLHNVLRYNKKNLASNTSYGQMGHITIYPFNYADACKLLLNPLGYLGFTIPDSEIVSTILSKTNYFPGLIQYYGQKILENVESAYQMNNFKDTENPPFILDEKYLKALMDDRNFVNEIENRFKLTLRIDTNDDDLYYVITLGVAYLYALEEPVTVSNLKQILCNTKIADLTDSQLAALLEELEELNVLREVNKDEYIFNRYSFFSMMGTQDKIEKEIEEYERAYEQQLLG